MCGRATSAESSFCDLLCRQGTLSPAPKTLPPFKTYEFPMYLSHSTNRLCGINSSSCL